MTRMKMDNFKLAASLPTLIKASAYILLGVGAIANTVGYDGVGNMLLAAASLLGLKEATSGDSQ